MTTIDPYYVSIDSHIMATYANAIEVVDGLETIPGRRRTPQPGAYRDGAWPRADDAAPLFFRESHMRLRIWVSPFNADGNVTNTNGPRSHLRENLEALYQIIGGGRRSHTVQWIVPTATGTKTLENTALISEAVDPTGSTRLVRRMTIDLEFPFPFWRDTTTGEISVGPTSSNQTFTPGGTAPHVDMVLTCTSAGRVTHDETGDYVEALTGFTTDLAIDLRNGTVLQNGGASDGRGYFDANQPWGLRLPAGVEANLTLTGTWTIDRYNLEH